MGGYSQIEAVLQLIKMVNHSGKEYEYLHFFQNSDLPIKNQDEIHKYFHKNLGTEFIMIEKKRFGMAINKTHYRHFFCHNRFFRRSKLVKALNFGCVQVQKILKMEINTDIQVYQGSALFSITDECARFIESKEYEIKKRFKYSLAGDEVFLQTILMNSNFREKIANFESENTSNARLIDRSRPDGKNSPHIWRRYEVDYILEQPEEICFCRKFDEKEDYDIVLNLKNSIKNISCV